ncbi:MAG: hypothetical protein ACI4DZ_01600 [Oliverpabstia sp.]
MKYSIKKAITSGSLALTLLFSGCGHDNHPDFLAEHQWVYFTNCDETISFHNDGGFAYYCACGSPVGSSDLFDSYTYNTKTSEIILSPEQDGNVIPVLRQEKSRLLLETDGQMKEFFDIDDPMVSCPETYASYDPEDYTYNHSSYLALFDKAEDSISTAPSSYAADPSGYEEYLLSEKLAENVTFFKWTLKIEQINGEESISNNYEELTEEEAEELLKADSAVGFVWYNDQIEIEKIVFADTSSYF